MHSIRIAKEQTFQIDKIWHQNLYRDIEYEIIQKQTESVTIDHAIAT